MSPLLLLLRFPRPLASLARSIAATAAARATRPRSPTERHASPRHSPTGARFRAVVKGASRWARATPGRLSPHDLHASSEVRRVVADNRIPVASVPQSRGDLQVGPAVLRKAPEGAAGRPGRRAVDATLPATMADGYGRVSARGAAGSERIAGEGK